jgi:hypothetical protein
MSNQNSNYALPLLAGFILNIGLVIYVYLLVEGGPVAGNWLEILNEVPQTILIFIVAIFLPYFMLWSRRKKISSTLFLAGCLMLTTTAASCLVIASANEALTKEMTMDIGWLALWGIAVYFVIIPPPTSSRE